MVDPARIVFFDAHQPTIIPEIFEILKESASAALEDTHKHVLLRHHENAMHP